MQVGVPFAEVSGAGRCLLGLFSMAWVGLFWDGLRFEDWNGCDGCKVNLGAEW